MATVAKNIIVCYDVISHPLNYYFNFDPYVVGWTATYINGPLPTGITAIDNEITGYTLGLSIDDNLTTGTFTVNLVVFNPDETIYGYFDYVITRGECITEMDVCCGDGSGAVIRWLGVNGSVRQWTFPGVREFEVRVGDANTFKNTSRDLFYSERKNIYIGKRVSTGSITQAQMEYMAELRYSIQAWEWNNAWEPIVVNNDSFPLSKSKQKFFDEFVSYVVAREVRVQTQ